MVRASHHIPRTLSNWKHVKPNIWSSTSNWNVFSENYSTISNKQSVLIDKFWAGGRKSKFIHFKLWINHSSETASVMPQVWCLPPQILLIPSLPFILVIRASLGMSAPSHAFPNNHIYSSFSQILTLPFSLELKNAPALKCLCPTVS